MQYVSSTLSAGERVLLGPIRQTRWQYVTLWALLVLPLLVIWVRRWSTEYALTTRRIVTKTGLVGREGDELRLRRIESVQVRQSAFGRLMGFGSVIVTGQGNQTVVLRDIVDPLDVKRRMEDAIEAAEATPAPPEAMRS